MEAHFQMKHSLTSRVYQLLDPSIPRQNPRHTCHGRNIKKLMLKVNTTYGGKCEWCFPFSSSFKGWQIEGTLNKNIQKHTKTKVPCKQFFIISSGFFLFQIPSTPKRRILGTRDGWPITPKVCHWEIRSFGLDGESFDSWLEVEIWMADAVGFLILPSKG